MQQIVPTEDIFVTYAYHEGIEDVVADLRHREITCGHWVIVSDPEIIARWTSEFVDEHSGG